MEKPKIRRVPLGRRCLSSRPFSAVGPTSWECDGRGVKGYGLDPEAAYRNWRLSVAEKKRRGISNARHSRWQDQMVAEGRAYLKPDGSLKFHSIVAPARKAEPARKPSFLEKVFGK